MFEPILLKNDRPDRPATFDEYRHSGGYEALTRMLRDGSPEKIMAALKDSGLRGRGGAGFPTHLKWGSVPMDVPGPKYVIPNTDEMEPGTFKDRVLVNADPHMVIEGIILSGFAIQADRAIFFIRPSYEMDAELIERELTIAREAGFLGQNILGSDFSFDISVHRSGGRYICGEASAQIKAIEGERVRPHKIQGVHETEHGLYGRPTLVNNVETLACVPHIVRNGGEWFKKLARTPDGAGSKLYTVAGKVQKPGCYEYPIGTPLREILEEGAGGMVAGSGFKACMPGGASTSYMTAKDLDVAMDFDSLKKIGHRLGTAAVIVFDQNTCLVAATLNLITFFCRESCGWCTPCREGLPFVKDLLERIENGEGKEEHIGMLEELCNLMNKSYCAFAPGAVSPVRGLLKNFKNEVLEHISQHGCPLRCAK